MSIKFDCIIPVAGKDCQLLRNLSSLVLKNLSPERLYIITKAPFFLYFEDLESVRNGKIVLIDEDVLLEGISYTSISKILETLGRDTNTTGWYLQQFLKMGFALSDYADKYYLSFDSDTYPVNRIEFFDENGKPYFSMKEEYHKPYFETIKALLGLEKSTERSFISENMLFDVQIMRQLIAEIEQSDCKGRSWFEKILYTMPSEENNAFSEFETYGTYVLNRFPETYAMRTLQTNRRAGKNYSRFISPNQLEKKASNYDIVTLEFRNSPNNLIGLYQRLYKKFIKNKNKRLVSGFQNRV